MKKSLAAVATASFLALGAIGFVGGPASAECPYTTCTGTTPAPSVPNTVPVGQKAKLKFKVKAAGNVTPTGTVKFIVKSKGFKFTSSKAYKGGKAKVNTTKLPKRGTYTVKIKFIPTPGSIFNPSSVKDTIKVV